MIKVPTLEEQRATQQFQYDRIMLLLFSQTKFDKVLKPSKKHHKPQKFNAELLEDFESKSMSERYEIIKKMPRQLRQRLLGDFYEPEDEIKVWSHHCKLEKTTDEDAGKWMCKGLSYDGKTFPCMKGMKSVQNSKLEQGWMCPCGDFCDDKPADAKDGEYTHYALCIECLRINYLVD